MTTVPQRPRQPRPKRGWGPVWAAGLFGMVMGLVAGTLIYGGKLNALTFANRTLQEELNALRQDYNRLREEMPGRNRPVRELSLQFVNLKDEHVRLELNRALRSLLVDRIVGTAVTDVDPLLAARIVHDRTFVVEDRLWRVNVAGAYLIWDTLILYVEALDEGAVLSRVPGRPPASSLGP